MDKLARWGKRGLFNFTVITNYDRASGSSMIFDIPYTSVPSYLHCRVNDIISPSCTSSGTAYTVTLPFTMTNGVAYQFMISTRGNDLSSTTREGL